MKKSCLVARDKHWVDSQGNYVSNSPMFHSCTACPFDVADCWRHCSSKQAHERECMIEMGYYKSMRQI